MRWTEGRKEGREGGEGNRDGGKEKADGRKEGRAGSPHPAPGPCSAPDTGPAGGRVFLEIPLPRGRLEFQQQEQGCLLWSLGCLGQMGAGSTAFLPDKS